MTPVCRQVGLTSSHPDARRAAGRVTRAIASLPVSVTQIVCLGPAAMPSGLVPGDGRASSLSAPLRASAPMARQPRPGDRASRRSPAVILGQALRVGDQEPLPVGPRRQARGALYAEAGPAATVKGEHQPPGTAGRVV